VKEPVKPSLALSTHALFPLVKVECTSFYHKAKDNHAVEVPRLWRLYFALPYQRVRLAWVSHNWGKDQSYVFSSSVLAQSIPPILILHLRWTPVSRPIYGQSKLSVKGSLQGCWSLRTLLLNGRHLLPYRLMDNSAPSHSRRRWVCDTPTPDGAARRCKTQSSALTLAVPPARCCTLVETPPHT
jgi:hypothetical protein